MILNNDRALKVAEFLLQIKAIKLQPANPFTWASGWKSPIYCDNRKTLSYPTIRTFIRQSYAEVILDKFGKPGALVAQELGVPFIYVRTSPKAHGLGNQIEGDYESGQKIVVIEDLISTGGSSLQAVEALRAAGCEVKGLVAIFSYGFDVAIQNFKDAKCQFETLTNYDFLMEEALRHDFITKDDLESLKKWRENPSNWTN